MKHFIFIIAIALSIGFIGFSQAGTEETDKETLHEAVPKKENIEKEAGAVIDVEGKKDKETLHEAVPEKKSIEKEAGAVIEAEGADDGETLHEAVPEKENIETEDVAE